MAFFGRQRTPAALAALYGAIVAQARDPLFYAEYGVPDTLDGRFDMIVLHLWLALRRLRATAELRAAGQSLFDAFCRDMDANLREMGVGDTRVPKRMRGFGEAFYGRAAAYDAALASPDPGELPAALRRNVYAGTAIADAQAARLAAFVRTAEAALRDQDPHAMAQGNVTFPGAAAVPAGDGVKGKEGRE